MDDSEKVGKDQEIGVPVVHYPLEVVYLHTALSTLILPLLCTAAGAQRSPITSGIWRLVPGASNQVQEFHDSFFGLPWGSISSFLQTLWDIYLRDTLYEKISHSIIQLGSFDLAIQWP